MHQLRMTRRTALGLMAAAAAQPKILLSQTTSNSMPLPRFHAIPPYGRVNDPQRPLWWNNYWHLWLLWNDSYPAVSGGTEWRHYTSQDLVTWADKGVSIPKNNAAGDVWTGSAVVDSSDTAGHGVNALIAVMTMPNDQNDVQRQSQALWYTTDLSQQFTFDRIVMPNFGPADFRDPKVFWSEAANSWIATLSEADNISVYTSPDLQNWSYASHILPSGWNSGMGTPECTSLIRLHFYNADGTTGSDKWVLMCGLTESSSLGYNTYYWTGNFDEAALTFTPDNATGQWLDGGSDCYATVLFQDAGILDYAYSIAWNNNWTYAEQESYNGYSGQAGITRKLRLQDVNGTATLVGSALPALDALFTNRLGGSDKTISDDQPYAWPAQPSDYACRIEFTLSPGDGGWPTAIYLSVRADSTYFTQIGFLPGNGQAYTWRSLSNDPAKMPTDGAWTDYRYAACDFSGSVHVVVYVDVGSVETFLNDGRTMMSTLLIAPDDAMGLNLTTSGGSVVVSNVSMSSIS